MAEGWESRCTAARLCAAASCGHLCWGGYQTPKSPAGQNKGGERKASSASTVSWMDAGGQRAASRAIPGPLILQNQLQRNASEGDTFISHSSWVISHPV